MLTAELFRMAKLFKTSHFPAEPQPLSFAVNITLLREISLMTGDISPAHETQFVAEMASQ